jgi:farnesyl-diphosphate farnesyltransferase
MSAPAAPLLTGLLERVTRSFYLTLRVLPGGVRPQIGLAYLLARTTDTIADTPLAPVADRVWALRRLRSRILGESTAPLELERWLAPPGAGAAGAAAAERELLQRVEEALALLARQEEADRLLIRGVLGIVTGGQELDLLRFGGAAESAEGSSAPRLTALATEAELDDYTYRVAGCVGEFWTRLCRAHLFPGAPLDEGWLVERGMRLGKGLQLVNVLRDVPRDLRQGRCYLPADGLAAAGLAPGDLLDPRVMPRLRGGYDRWLERAAGYLADGWAYTNALPRGQVRLRLACAWPILLGVNTVARLRAANVLDPERRVKVPRARVRSLLARSVLGLVWPPTWNRLIEQAGRA